MTTGRINQVTGTGLVTDDYTCVQYVRFPDLLESCINATNCSGPKPRPSLKPPSNFLTPDMFFQD